MYRKIFLFLFSIILMSFALIQNHKITVWMIGDSTMSVKQPKAYPETGWGMPFSTFFNKKVTVDNRAMNGRSTLSFINEKRWQAVYDNLKEGDYVLIEFGHNDEKINKPGVGTTIEQYKTNLATFVSEARAKKAIPVLMTPIVRRNFQNGKLTDTHLGYSDAVRKVADSLHVPLVDMQKKTERLLTSLGDEGSVKLFNHVPPGTENYPDGKKDDTHLSPEGAKQIALLAAEGLKEAKVELVRYLREK